MSSTNKTENLKLNQWLGSDVPERIDFVADNAIIDSAFGRHDGDVNRHISNYERSVWNSPYYAFRYSGNGQNPREIISDCEFEPTWGIVFALSYTPSVVDFNSKSNYNYFGIFSKWGSTPGVSIVNGKNLRVLQATVAVQDTEYRNYNENGVMYLVIMFR